MRWFIRWFVDALNWLHNHFQLIRIWWSFKCCAMCNISSYVISQWKRFSREIDFSPHTWNCLNFYSLLEKLKTVQCLQIQLYTCSRIEKVPIFFPPNGWHFFRKNLIVIVHMKIEIETWMLKKCQFIPWTRLVSSFNFVYKMFFDSNCVWLNAMVQVKLKFNHKWISIDVIVGLLCVYLMP